MSMCEEALYPLQEGLGGGTGGGISSPSPTTVWCPASALSKLTSGACRLHLALAPTRPPSSQIVGGHMSPAYLATVVPGPPKGRDE